jgi:hypothetical protein
MAGLDPAIHVFRSSGFNAGDGMGAAASRRLPYSGLLTVKDRSASMRS